LIVILEPEITAFIDELIRLKTKHPNHTSKIDFLQLYLVDLRQLLLDPHEVSEDTVKRLSRDLDQFIEEMQKLRQISPQNANRIEFLVKHILELREYVRRPSFLIEVRTVIRIGGSRVGSRGHHKEIIRVPREKTAEERR
jgi:hypothetical protein